MQLRSLQYFLAVAERENFHRAAEALGLSQPALTMQVQTLEEDLGIQLFTRERQSVSLTYAGAVVQNEAQDLLKFLQDAVDLTKRAAQGVRQLLRVGFVSSLATTRLLPCIVSLFSKEYPDVALELKNISVTDQITLLRQGYLDIGFIRLPALLPSFLEIIPVYDEPMVLILPSHHRLAALQDLKLQDLAHDSFVLYSRAGAPGYYDFIMRTIANAGFSPIVTQEVGEMYTMVSLVAAGRGVALGPSSTRHYNMTNVDFRCLPKLPRIQLAVAARKDENRPEYKGLVDVAIRAGTALEKH